MEVDDPSARPAFEQRRVHDRAAARHPDVQAHPAALALGAQRARDRRHLDRRRAQRPFEASARRGRRAHAPFERAQRRARRQVDARDRRAGRRRASSATRVCRKISPPKCKSAFDEAAGNDESPAVFSAGAQNLLDQPEFHDLRKLRSILRIVEEQKVLYELIADSMTSERSDGPHRQRTRRRRDGRVQRRHRAVPFR